MQLPNNGGSIDAAAATSFLDVFAGGVDSLRGNYAFDHPNPLQAVGFNISSSGAVMFMIFNGNINTENNNAPSLIQAAAPVNNVPEPTTLALLGIGFAGVTLTRRAKKKQIA